jgi:hypothetical protein
VEYSRKTSQILSAFNSTFIALIPKYNNPHSFDQFKPILLCNSKIISKLIARRLLDFLSDYISLEQLNFLKGRQIHEAIGLAQEGLHSIHTCKQKAVTLKVDLSKAFGKVS